MSTKTSRIRTPRKTHPRVYWVDRVARWVITASGFAAIAAVLLVGLFLLFVAVPLFRSAKVSLPRSITLDASISPRDVLHFEVNEYQTLAWLLLKTGNLAVIRLNDGKILEETPLKKKVTAFSFIQQDTRVGDAENLILGFEDGSISPAHIDFSGGSDSAKINFENADFINLKGAPKTAVLNLGHTNLAGGGAGHELRILIEYEDRLILFDREKTANLLTGKDEVLDKTATLTSPPTTSDYLFLSEMGTNGYSLSKSGLLWRFNLQDSEKPFLAEALSLGGQIGSVTLLNGRNTFLIGDATGKVRSYFTHRLSAGTEQAPGPGGSDSFRTEEINYFKLAKGQKTITALTPSSRSRVFAAADNTGNIFLLHATSGKTLARISSSRSHITNIEQITFAPREDGIWTLNSDGTLAQMAIALRYPEASTKTLLRPVWYEGYDKKAYVWQSSSASDTSEPKLSLIPLIFGTLKATLYSLIFGVPIALLAAIYTSEFLNRRLRGSVKQTLELMASLPSVVLGFLAANIFSPLLETVLMPILTAFILIPFAFFLAAQTWLLLPTRFRENLRGLRLPLMILTLMSGIFLSNSIAKPIEVLFFSGNIKGWLDHQSGSAFGGWFYLFIPLAALALTFFSRGFLSAVLTRFAPRSIINKGRALFNLVLFLMLSGLTLVTAAASAKLVTYFGFDPRGGIVGTYMQRNALVVGIVMGFAIIPIIYTLADDALAMVPQHLRIASLGAGATTWQTVRYVVIPAAMSGLFSAVMIGVGRAVGETMLVLMAAGNTPILDWNIFEGFRTLSANIAVELPEAVKDSTHYRVLFLSALILFGFTSLLNVFSESVRVRFRAKVKNL